MKNGTVFFCLALLVVIVFFSGCSGNSSGSHGIATSTTLSGNSGASDTGTTKTPLTESSPVVTPTNPPVTKTETTPIPVRLTSGTFLKRTIFGGFNEMTLINHCNEDAVVIITQADTPLIARDSVYVQSGGYLFVPSIPNGEYSVYFTTGTDWNSTAHKFNRNAVYKKFKDNLGFSSEGNQYQRWKIGIGSTDRDAKTEDVSEGHFPS